MDDHRMDAQKQNTSFQAFNIIFAYVCASMLLGWALIGDWMLRNGSSYSYYGDYYRARGFGLISDKYYWWVFGAFIFCTLAAILGRYCMNASVDSE